MRNSSEYATQLLKLCRKLQRDMGAPSVTVSENATEEVILGFLSSVVTEAKAGTTLEKLKKKFVDFNELRVCRDVEVAKLLGASFPQGKSVAKNIIRVLQQIYDQHDSLRLSDFLAGGKREAKAFLEEIKGLDAYVIARVMLLCLEAQAFPVNASLATMLRGEKVVDPGADEAKIQGFLERQIPSKDIFKYYLLLRKHADSYKAPEAPAPKKKAAAKKTVAKKTAVKKTVKKTVKKAVKTNVAATKKTEKKKAAPKKVSKEK